MGDKHLLETDPYKEKTKQKVVWLDILVTHWLAIKFEIVMVYHQIYSADLKSHMVLTAADSNLDNQMWFPTISHEGCWATLGQ